MLILTAILAAILLFAEYRITSFNMNIAGNGYGSFDLILKGKGFQPLQYRILTPWLYAILPIKDKIVRYLTVKWIGIWFALYAFALFCDSFWIDPLTGVLFMSAILPLTFVYDYTDCYYDLGFMALAFAIIAQGRQDFLLWLVPITLLASLNRESGVFIPLGYFVLTGGYVGAALLLGVAVVGLIIPRAYYGKRPRYCSFIMWKQNIVDMRKRFTVFHYIFFAIMLWFIAAGFLCNDPTLMPLYWLMCFFVIAMSIPSIWLEVRVFMPVLLVTIPITLNLL